MQVVERNLPDTSAVNRAFSKQSVNYDRDDKQNPILQDMRRKVYEHISVFLREKCSILELNAGTGIDAVHFAKQGHDVLATDLSDGMMSQIKKKIVDQHLENKLTCQQLSYEQLDKLAGKKFDFVFSNFGGLNCIDDLTRVTAHLPALLRPGSYVTWVIMPPVCLWELAWIFKGHGQLAFRRFHKDGVMAHLEGEYFKTFYHPLSQIRYAFGPRFKFMNSIGLCALAPPPSRGDFPSKHPRLYTALQKMDSAVGSTFPFNRWADHLIVTFRFSE